MTMLLAKMRKPLAALALTALATLALALLPACAKKKPDTRPTLTIQSTPGKALVSLDGKELDATPVTLRLSPKTYVFKIDKPNFKTDWEEVAVREGENKILEVQLQPITAAVMINSVPAGAKVKYNGALLGETPIVLKDLPIGTHSATLERNGFSTKTVEWTVEDARPKQLKVEMASNVGTLRVDSTPSGANLSIDGEPRGRTPFNDKVEQGPHKIRVERDGFAVFEHVATVNRDKATVVNAPLQVLPGSIKISSSPSGATVFLDEKQQGSTPMVIADLQPGAYKIALEKPGHDRAISDVTVRPGQTLDIDLNMDSNTGGIDMVVNPPGVTIYVDGRQVGASELDPNTPGVSKVFSVRNLAAGRHVVTAAHKRASPDKKDFQIEVRKGKIERMPSITLWIANAIITAKGGQPMTGRIVSESDSEIMFEPVPGIRQAIQKSNIDSRKDLKSQE